MSMTATIALTQNTALINEPINATLTVSNSGSDPVNMLTITPTAIGSSNPTTISNAPCSFGNIPLGQGSVITVPAGGSLKFSFACRFFAPSASGSGTYSIGAICYSNDGSVFTPIPATATISAPVYN